MIKRDVVVTIVGGSGFLGRYIVKEIAKTGARIKLISRHASENASLRIAGSVGQIGFIDCDVKDPEKLEKAIKGSDYVINLVGILYSAGKQDFYTIHTKTAALIAKVCTKHRIKKLIHVSALGIDRALTSQYAKSKLDGENAVLQNFHTATIFRPSVMFGLEDNFINMFNTMAKFSLVLPAIGRGSTRLQPVYVADVAKAIVRCLHEDSAKYYGHIYELGGPNIISIRELLSYILKVTHRCRLILPLPFTLAKFAAFFIQLLPKKLLTVDQVELLRYDNIVSKQNGFNEFGITPIPIEAVAPQYLG